MIYNRWHHKVSDIGHHCFSSVFDSDCQEILDWLTQQQIHIERIIREHDLRAYLAFDNGISLRYLGNIQFLQVCFDKEYAKLAMLFKLTFM